MIFITASISISGLHTHILELMPVAFLFSPEPLQKLSELDVGIPGIIFLSTYFLSLVFFLYFLEDFLNFTFQLSYRILISVITVFISRIPFVCINILPFSFLSVLKKFRIVFIVSIYNSARFILRYLIVLLFIVNYIF